MDNVPVGSCNMTSSAEEVDDMDDMQIVLDDTGQPVRAGIAKKMQYIEEEQEYPGGTMEVDIL